jgi:hypothetical protein
MKRAGVPKGKGATENTRYASKARFRPHLGVSRSSVEELAQLSTAPLENFSIVFIRIFRLRPAPN